jgi:hypothetical protein
VGSVSICKSPCLCLRRGKRSASHPGHADSLDCDSHKFASFILQASTDGAAGNTLCLDEGGADGSELSPKPPGLGAGQSFRKGSARVIGADPRAGRVVISTFRRDFAVDLLQMQRQAIVDTTFYCARRWPRSRDLRGRRAAGVRCLANPATDVISFPIPLHTTVGHGLTPMRPRATCPILR